MTKRATSKSSVEPLILNRHLQTTKPNANVFVLGDLIIDHTVFVSGTVTSYPLPVSGEMAYQVKRRMDSAGGAATTARAINMLSNGTTFLWGLIGRSPWGSFRYILENSQALDGAVHRIEFRGAHDETDAPMTTITRLVAVHDAGSNRERCERKARFADYGNIHVPPQRQIEAIKYHLDRVQQTKAPLDAIILNDLDMGALRHKVVEEVIHFATQFHVPVIIRARRDASKYVEVQARALVCTLAEWKLLVNSKAELDYWTRNIRKAEVAADFARLTFRAFRKIDRCIILVGDDWIDSIILVERPSKASDPCRVFTAGGLPIEEKGKSQQVGASDVFTGALALGLCTKNEPLPTFQSVLAGAIRIVHVYQHRGWHLMPPAAELTYESQLVGNDCVEITSQPFGTPYLPTTTSIDMGRAKTCVPGFYSVTRETTDKLQQMLKDLKDEDKSLVLVAPGGNGKTEIAKHMLITAQHNGLGACYLDDLGVEWNWSNPEKTVNSISDACRNRSSNKPFIVVDEVLKKEGAKHLSTKGVVLLDRAKEAGIRFLLIDADFAKLNFDKLKSQFARRVVWYSLSPAWDRPNDIPYVFASGLRQGEIGDVSCSIEESALLAIIEWMLQEKQNFGSLVTVAKEMLREDVQKNNGIIIRWEQLPPSVTGKRLRPELADRLFTIQFD